MSFKQEAREELANRLRFGDTVSGLTLRDLIISDLAGDNHASAELEVAGLLVSDEPDRSFYVGRYLDGLINKWLDKKEDLIAELAAEMAEDYSQSVAA